MNTERLITLYRQLLAPAGWVADEEGYVSVDEGGTTTPCLIAKANGKETRLVLPTQHQLEKRERSGLSFFHTLDEHIMNGETEVMKAHRDAVIDRINTGFLVLGSELLVIAGSQKKHAKLSPVQSEFLSHIGKVDDTTLEKFTALIAATEEAPKERNFVSVYLKKGGTLDNSTHQRVAVTFFPMYEALVKDGLEREKKMEERRKLPKEDRHDVANRTFGVELRVADRETFIKLFEFLVPGIADKDFYSSASNAAVGVSTDALMKAVAKLAVPLNTWIDRYAKVLPNMVQLKVPLDWKEAFDNIDSYASDVNKIPTQRDSTKASSTPQKAPERAERGERGLPSRQDQESRPEASRGAGQATSSSQALPLSELSLAPVRRDWDARSDDRRMARDLPSAGDRREERRDERRERSSGSRSGALPLSDLELPERFGHEPYQPLGSREAYDRDYRREDRDYDRGNDRPLSASDVMGGIGSSYYDNNHRAPFSPNRSYSRRR